MEGSDQQRLGSRSLGARVQSTSCMFHWSAALYTSQYINYITLQLHCIHRSTSITSHYIALHSISAAKSFYLEFCINLEMKDFLNFSVMVESVL